MSAEKKARQRSPHPVVVAEKKTARTVAGCERFVLVGSDGEAVGYKTFADADAARELVGLADGSCVAEPVFMRQDVAQEYATAAVALAIDKLREKVKASYKDASKRAKSHAMREEREQADGEAVGLIGVLDVLDSAHAAAAKGGAS